VFSDVDNGRKSDVYDDHQSSASRRRSIHSRISDTDMFLISSAHDSTSTSAEGPVVISEDDEERSASTSAYASPPACTQSHRAKRRSSVLLPLHKSSPFRHDDKRDVKERDDTNNDEEVNMRTYTHIFQVNLG